MLMVARILFRCWLLTTFLFVGCSNEGESALAASESQLAVLNPELNGYLIVDKGFNGPLLLVNMRTGVESSIPNTDWEDQRTRFPNGTDSFHPIPNAYGKLSETEIVLRVNNCEGSFSSVTDCIVIQGINGEYKEEFPVYTDASFAQMSPDGKYIATYKKLGGNTSNDSLQVYTRDGEWQYGLDFDSSDIHRRRFQWSLDGKLYVPFEASVEIFGPYSSKGAGALRSSEYPDNFGFLRISPDGKRMIFFSGGKFYIADTNGTEIREFAASVDSRSLTGPSWSPDGKYVLMLSGFINNTGVFGLGIGGDFRLFAIPTNLPDVQYISAEPSETSPAVIPVKRIRNGVESLKWQNDNFYWKS